MKTMTTSRFMWMMLAMMALSFTFTSCDTDDEYTAYTLEGTWSGRVFVSSSWNGHTYSISYSELCFARDPYRYAEGTGYWIDYYSNAPWDYVANHIEWRVYGGEIEIYFYEDDYTYYISDYRLNSNHFRGRIYDGDYYVDFDLTHTASPNWNTYNYGFDYNYWGDYYWSNTTQMDNDEGMRRAKSTVTMKAPIRNLSNTDK